MPDIYENVYTKTDGVNMSNPLGEVLWWYLFYTLTLVFFLFVFLSNKISSVTMHISKVIFS